MHCYHKGITFNVIISLVLQVKPKVLLKLVENRSKELNGALEKGTI